METIARTFIIPSRQNQFIQENIFNSAPIRRIAVAMNTNSAVAGSFHENSFNYQQFHLRVLRIIRSGLNLQTKQIMNAVYLKTHEISSTLTVNQCSIAFVQFTSFVYGTLLIQYLNASKSITLGFIHPKLQYQTIYFFVSDVN